MLNFYPTPNLPGTSQGAQNWTGAPFSTIDWKDFWWRIDQTLGPNHRLYFSYNLYRCLATQNIYFGKPYLGYGDIWPTGLIQDNHHDMGTLDDVINLSNSWVLNMRYGFTRFMSRQPSVNNGVDLKAIGFNQQMINEVPQDLITLPALTISGYQAIGTNSGSKSFYTNQNFFASAVNMRGNHSLKLGTELRVAQRTGYNYGSLIPAYTFGSDWVKATDTSATAPIGMQLASFMYGLPTDGSKNNNASYATTSKYVAWYVHDDWKVTRKLTLNLGIRHEIEIPTTERYDRTNRGFAFADANPVQAAAQANYALNPISQIPVSQFKVLGGLMFAGVGGNPRGVYGVQARNFMPRMGLAYQLNNKTVLRGGFGVFFDSMPADSRGAITQTGFSLATSMMPSIDNGLNFRVNLGNYPVPGRTSDASRRLGRPDHQLGVVGVVPEPGQAPGLRAALELQCGAPDRGTNPDTGRLYRQSGQPSRQRQRLEFASGAVFEPVSVPRRGHHQCAGQDCPQSVLRDSAIRQDRSGQPHDHRLATGTGLPAVHGGIV